MKRIFRDSIDCGQFIKGHPKCGEQHGHTYDVEIILDDCSEDPPNRLDFLDFLEIKERSWKVLGLYDHKNLGDKTAEEFVRELYRRLSEEFDTYEVTVTLFETRKFGVRCP